jgi:exosortase/archaeosortase family protein
VTSATILPQAWRPWMFCAACIGVPLVLHGMPGYAGPVALGFLPLPPQHHHLAILLAGLTLWLAHDARMAASPGAGRKQALAAGLLAFAAAVFAYRMTHPSAERLAVWQSLHAGPGLALTAAAYLSLLLPGALSFGVFYPWSTLRRCIRPLAVCAALGAGFVVTGIVSTVWHAPLAGPALELAAWILRLIDPSATTADPGTYVIGFRGFATRVGPQCAALDGVLLFLLLAFALWRYRNGARPLKAAVTAIVLAAALFLGNGVRIAGIMVIGSYDKTLGMDLFHGLAGTLMVLGMLWAFDLLAARKPA